MKIIMTGKSGLIGSAIYGRLVTEGHRVVSIGRREADHEMDLNRFAPLRSESSCDVFIHCAGITDEEIRKEKMQAIRRGTAETAALLDWAASLNPRKIVYISTAHVYGELNREINEDSAATPVSLYATLHLFCEQYIRLLGIHHLILRPLTVFGKIGKRFDRWGLIPFSFPRSLALENRIVINTHGRQFRNFVSTDTIANVVSKEVNQTISKTMNLVGPHSMSVFDFAHYCVDTLNPLSGNRFEVVTKEISEYINRFRFLSNHDLPDEPLGMLKDHIVSLYEQVKSES
jgi:UDP-glucose 4-epimerase